MPNVTTHLTKTTLALIIGLSTLVLLTETYFEYELTIRILVYSGLCCLVGGCAPDIDQQNSVPAVLLWCLLLLVMCAGFLRIYFDHISLLMPDLTTIEQAVLMYGFVLILVPLANTMYEQFQNRVPHRKILHELLKTGGLTATFGAFILPSAYMDGGMTLLIERGIYLASFQYGVILHIILDKSRVAKILAG